jgi:hypothetical protein
VELLSNVDLLISADSGPVHIAAAVGAKVIAIEGGSAHGWETAPYGAGHWVLQPHLKYLMSRVPDKKLASASAASISVESVLTVIEASLDKRHVPVADQGCTIYETTSDGHNLSLEPRAGAMMQIDEWYSVLRRIWRAVLSRGVLSITLLDSPAGRCALTARGLSKVGVSNQCRLEELASRLRMEQEQLTAFLLKLPPLHALARYMEISLAAVEGATLRQQALESAEVFEQIAYGIDVLTREEKDRNQTIKHNNVREAACASI